MGKNAGQIWNWWDKWWDTNEADMDLENTGKVKINTNTTIVYKDGSSETGL